MSFLLKDLSPGTNYYLAVKSIDVFNNVSPLSNILVIRTLKPPIPELITTQLSEQLFTGGILNRKIFIKNIGEEELLVRSGVPELQSAPVLPQLGAKGRLFAINTSTNMIEELNSKTGEVIRSVPMPEPSSKTIEGLAFDGTNLYYGRSQKIYKIHSTTGEIVSTLFLNDATTIIGLAWSGRYLYVSRYNSGNYGTHEVDVDDGRIVRTLSHYSELAFFGTNNTLLTSGTGRINEVDVSSGNVVREISATNPRSIAFSSNDDLLFVQNSNEFSIKAIKPTDGSVAYSFPYPITSALAGDENNLGWFTSANDVIAVGSGQIGEIPVTFTSAGLHAGTLTGFASVIPMNSKTNALSVPLALTVISGTDIETASEINFGTRFIGFSIDTTVIVENRGFAPLNITQIQSDNNRVISSLSLATLAPGQRINMQVSVQSNFTGPIEASITFTSNDPDEGVLSVPVRGLIIPAPEINVTPDSLLVILREGAEANRTITIRNIEGSTFFWNAGLSGTDPTGNSQTAVGQSQNIEPLSPIQKTSFGEIVLKSSSPETLTGLVYDPIGELIYAKSLAGESFYTYNPISDTWSQIGLAPSGFYGQATYLSGKLYFGGTQLNVYSIQSKIWSAIPFPIVGSAESLTNDDKFIYVAIDKTLFRYDPISGNWLELSPVPGPLYMSGFGALSYHSGTIYANGAQGITGDGNTLFFKYFPETNSWFTSDRITGRVSLGGAIDASTARYFVVGAPGSLPENRIQMSILDIRSGEWTKLAMPFPVGYVSGLTFVGKEGVSGIYLIQGDGTKFGYYETPSASNWFTVTPSSGSLNVGESQSMNVSVNAQSLFGGVYRGNIKIYSTRPNIQKNVPLELRVAGTPSISFDKHSEDLGNVIVGYDRGTYLTIRNRGSSELVVSSISTSSSDFSATESSLRLPVGESKTILVFFKPTSVGKQVGSFTFSSNDPLQSEVSFTLTGTGVYPASLRVPTDTIKAALLTGQTVKKKFMIENIGQGATQYLVVYGDKVWIELDSVGLAMNINANSSREFEAKIHSTGFTQGRYRGGIVVVDYGDPTNTSYTIPIVLDVTSAPDFTTTLDSLDFGNQFVTGEYDSTFQVENKGALPLTIFSLDIDNPAFKVSSVAPVTLQPGAAFDVTIRFSPISDSPQKGKLTFTTNDPDESLAVTNITGTGIIPPRVVSGNAELFFTSFPGESRSEEISLSNEGGSILKWRIDKELNMQSMGGVFTRKADVPLPFQYSGISLTAVTADPVSGELYGQYLWYQELYTYTPTTNTWTKIGQVPARSYSALAGAVILDKKMYCSYSDDPSKIYIFDFTLKDWATRPNSLNFASATITTDGKLVYMAGEGKFASYNPRTGEWKSLLMPSLPLDGLGGLSYLDGAIYAHSSSNSRFSKFVINTGVWETLIPLPGKTSLGSTIDVVHKRYYAYGEDYLYEYDVANNVWTTLFVPLFKLGNNGGLAYTSNPGYEGVYFRQADSEKGFGRYEPASVLPWLRTSQIIGSLESMDSQTIAVNSNTTNLSPGLYHGKIKVTTNDPNNLAFDIPVTLTIKDPSPKITITILISDTVNRLVPTTKYVLIENEGRDQLDWSFATTLPNWLSANKTAGSIEGQAVDSIAISFIPTMFTFGGQADYTIEINSNDPAIPLSKTRLLLTLQNHQPQQIKPIPMQSLISGGIDIPLLEYFSDSDNDPLTFLTSTNVNSIVTTNVVGSTLIVNPLKTGLATVTVTAYDIYNSSVKSEFEVNTLVTGIADDSSELTFSMSPNPFSDKLKINFGGYNLEKAGLKIIDVTGRVVYEYSQNNFAALNGHEVDTSKFNPGLYVCLLSLEDRLVSHIKLLKK